MPYFEVPRLGPYWMDALSAIAFIAGSTRRVRMTTSVLAVPYHHPLALAKTLSSIDVLSGGRLDVAAGIGHAVREFEVLGIPFAERGAITDETLHAMVELWSSDKPFFDGHYFQIDGLAFEPKPVQKPRPPIYIGGNSKPALRRAASYDGWEPNPTSFEVEEVPALMDYIRSQQDFAGKEQTFEVRWPGTIHVDLPWAPGSCSPATGDAGGAKGQRRDQAPPAPEPAGTDNRDVHRRRPPAAAGSTSAPCRCGRRPRCPARSPRRHFRRHFLRVPPSTDRGDDDQPGVLQVLDDALVRGQRERRDAHAVLEEQFRPFWQIGGAPAGGRRSRQGSRPRTTGSNTVTSLLTRRCSRQRTRGTSAPTFPASLACSCRSSADSGCTAGSARTWQPTTTAASTWRSTGVKWGWGCGFVSVHVLPGGFVWVHVLPWVVI